MGHLGVVLYEYLGEEYPEVLGSILGALKAIVNVIGMWGFCIGSKWGERGEFKRMRLNKVSFC